MGIDGIGRCGAWSPQFRYAARPHIAAACAELDEMGYGALWITSGLGGPVFDDLMNTARACPRALIVTGILNVWLHDAREACDGFLRMQSAYPGRFVLGLGVSHPSVVGTTSARPYRRPFTRMVEYLDELDALGAPPRERRLLAALGPRMLALAGERAAGAHPMLTTPEHTAAARAVLGPGPLLAPTVNVVLDSDRDRARDIVRASLGGRVRHPAYRATLLALGFDDADFDGDLSDRLLDAMAVTGDVNDVVRAVTAHEEAGADHVAISVLTEVPFDQETVPVAAWREIALALGL
jgi:probable F420-dependent oxidoreductase